MPFSPLHCRAFQQTGDKNRTRQGSVSSVGQMDPSSSQHSGHSPQGQRLSPGSTQHPSPLRFSTPRVGIPPYLTNSLRKVEIYAHETLNAMLQAQHSRSYSVCRVPHPTIPSLKNTPHAETLMCLEKMRRNIHKAPPFYFRCPCYT